MGESAVEEQREKCGGRWENLQWRNNVINVAADGRICSGGTP
jgi:hypothetical protein